MSKNTKTPLKPADGASKTPCQKNGSKESFHEKGSVKHVTTTTSDKPYPNGSPVKDSK